MSIPTLYVYGTKKAANEKLTEGKEFTCLEFNLQGANFRNLADMPDGTVIKFWEKRDHCGTPIAKSYGNWKPSKKRIV